jgi:hypothetical protein
MPAGYITSSKQNNAARPNTTGHEKYVNGREIMKDEWILHFKKGFMYDDYILPWIELQRNKNI